MIREKSSMEIAWDEGKDTANRAKHGVSLADAARLDWPAAFEYEDDRLEYSEERIKAFVPLSGRVMICIYTIREGKYRIISLRKANRREVRFYEQTQR